MTRKLALLLAACLGLWHGSAWALGLGEIEVRSGLNERFAATIELRRIETLSQNEIIASLASAEDFSRLGVQRFFYLSELEFSTDLSDRNRPLIRVSSNRPINEPFVNFVVDVRWPTGRMLREYTVLLDPPSGIERPVPAARPVETPASARPGEAPAQASRPQPTQVRTEPQASPGVGRFDGDSYGVTDRNDTLWAIALEVRPSTNFSVQQTMLALQRLNPDAFIGGNINLLKAGYVLQVPSAEEIARLSRRDAVVQVAEHNARWRDGTPAMPVDARPEAAVGEGTRRSPSGELRLITGEGDDVRVSRDTTPAGVGAVTGEAADALRSDLAAVESRLSEAEAARSVALRQREEMASELDQVSRQLELRNEELARLQGLLAQQQASSAAPRPSAPGPLGMDWTLLAGGLGGLVLMVAALLMLRRRREQGGDVLAADGVPEAGSQSIQQAPLLPSVSNEDLAHAGIVTGALAGNVRADDVEDESDVIAEADVYMAYGRFGEAARVLNSAIEADGQRADLRLKLMEVLVETQDVDAFNAQAEALRGFADQQAIGLADDLASRLPGGVTSTGATSEGELAGPTRTLGEGEVNLDFDLGDEFGEPADLDSLDIDFDASNKPKHAAALTDDSGDITLVLDDDGAEQVGTAKGDASLDLDLDLDEPRVEADGQDDELDLKFDLDGDDASLDDTLAYDGPVTRTPMPAGDFNLELPMGDSTAPITPLDGVVDESTSVDGGKHDGSEAPADVDTEFDLTMDGAGFVEKPEVAAPTRTAQDDGEVDDLDFDLAGGAGDPETTEPLAGEPSPGPEVGVASAYAASVYDDDDLNLDFDIEDLAAEASGAETPDAEARTEEDLSATLSRAADDAESEDVTDLLLSSAEEEDEDMIELSLEELDEDDSDSAEPPASMAAELPVDLADDDLEFDMDFDEAGDETSTKLELARAYIDMGDEDGAKEILDEVVRDGSDTQQQEAAELLARLG